jgi:hypothetical protein
MVITTLGDVLRDAEELDWRHALYLSLSEVRNEATPCAVIPPDESDNPDDLRPDDLPPFAKEHGLRYALGIAAVQDIIANARLQKPNADVGDLLTAFLFYFDHDAFIVF